MPQNLTDEHWFRLQAITWDNFDPDLCRHMVLLGHNELMARYSGMGTSILILATATKVMFPSKLTFDTHQGAISI